MTISDENLDNRMDRRSLVRNGTALIGAGFLGSFRSPSDEVTGKPVTNGDRKRHPGRSDNGLVDGFLSY